MMTPTYPAVHPNPAASPAADLNAANLDAIRKRRSAAADLADHPADLNAANHAAPRRNVSARWAARDVVLKESVSSSAAPPPQRS